MSHTARGLGVQALKDRDPRTAALHLTEAVKENPQDVQAFGYLGAAYGQLNMPDQAIECLSRACALAPSTAALRYNLGLAQERAGKRQEAVSSFQKALALDATHSKAREALARLAPAAPAAPVTPWGAPPPPAATRPGPVSPPEGLGEFALTLAEPLPAPAPPVGAPNPFAPAPPGAAGVPPASGFGAPPAGPQPLGDWQPAPPRPALPREGPTSAAVPDSRVATTAAIADDMTPSEIRGHSYLAGQGTGLWWGLIGAFFVFLWASVLIKSSIWMKMLPVISTLAIMYIALGVLLFGIVGLLGNASDEAETTCGNVGAAIGVLQAIGWFFFARSGVLWDLPLIVGCVWTSRMLGKSLGAKIDEFRASATIVTGPRGVSVTPIRRAS